MNRIQILDCTLRDGGYCNQWNFGYRNIQKIVSSLVEANIDIVECGFLTDRIVSDQDVTKYRSVDDISQFLPPDRQHRVFCAMINYGEFSIEELSEYQESCVQGIRVAFHKQDRMKALEYCRRVKEKGYLVFLQPMVSESYTDEEFLDLIRRANELQPYAFYIVDSFGMMKKKSLIHLFYMVEHNLQEDIWIGFHSHNNIQMAYSNAQSLVEAQTNRNLIIDASVYGMGRGAGNLNTELFVEYLNENIGTDYRLQPLLNVIDEILNEFYQRNYWGYSLPNYLSAAHSIHPNYALYLDDKKTLTLEDMDRLFAMMSREKGYEFDRKYIEELYRQYMADGKVQEERYTELRSFLKGKTVLLIAPGKSAAKEREKVIACASREDVVAVSINYAYPYYDTDFIFLSNLRRFRELDESMRSKCIVTSNIHTDQAYLRTDYGRLLNEVQAVQDNAGLMAVKFLTELGVEEILLAGLDGYSHDIEENYAERNLSIVMKSKMWDAINAGVQQVLSRYARQVNIRFLTTEKYIKLNKDEV